TAHGALGEINHRLRRVPELSVQALNDTYQGETADKIQAEINLNLKEIGRLNSITTFNDVPLLDGTGSIRRLPIGVNDGDILPVDFGGPGFNVQRVGLKCLNSQSAPNNVTPAKSIVGRAYSILLDDVEHTTVSYNPPASNPNLVRPDRSASRDVVQLNGPDDRLMENLRREVLDSAPTQW